MKKFYAKLFLVAGLFCAGNAFAQSENPSQPVEIPNGDFSERTANPDGVTASFTNWSGTGTITAEPGMDMPIGLRSYVQTTITKGECISRDKATGRCLQYAPDIVNYTPESQSVSLSTILSSNIALPAKLYGKYSFSGTSGITGIITVRIDLNNNTYYGELVTSNTTATTDFEIPLAATGACGGIKGCTDRLTISLSSCNGGSCPSASTPSASTRLVVDDLSFSPPVATGINDEVLGSVKVYPNPAKDVINFAGYGELYDGLGIKVAEGTDVINVANLTEGVYVLKTKNSNVKVVKN